MPALARTKGGLPRSLPRGASPLRLGCSPLPTSSSLSNDPPGPLPSASSSLSHPHRCPQEPQHCSSLKVQPPLSSCPRERGG